MDGQPKNQSCQGQAGLSIQGICKSFGDQAALDGVSLQVEPRAIIAVLGPSGCGKSTLLAIIAGLEKPDEGNLCWDGTPLAGTPVHQRGFGLMFQDFALFPHLNVFDNIAYGLRMRGWHPTHRNSARQYLAPQSKEAIRERVLQVLELVGLPDFDARDVNTLSGGEAQRVALARSLAPNPRLLMLDEPLGSLDRNLRERLILDVGQILRKSGQTAIYVTHDLEEAFTVADRVAVMNAGRIMQIDLPKALYQNPQSVFVARFLGLDNLIPGRIHTTGDGQAVETSLGTFPVADLSYMNFEDVQVLLRPDTADLDGNGDFHLQGRVKAISFRGSTTRATISSGEYEFNFDFPSNSSLPATGETISLSFQADQALQIFRE